jgi:hypothetical protein
VAQASRGERCSAVVCALASTLALSAFARADHVHQFEPTDLDLQPPGMLQLDLQGGVVHGSSAWRAIVPDFEVNLGLSSRVELDVDGAVGLESVDGKAFALKRVVADDLWISSKVGFFSHHDDGEKRSWAFGLQLGPKVPVAEGARGAGFEALALVGHNVRRVHLVFSAGGLVDPGAEVSSGRPVGVEAGADLNLDLNEDDTFSLLGELGGIAYLSDDPGQLAASIGIQWSPSELLDLSLVAVVGAGGADRYGLMLGVSPKVRLW